MNNEFLELRNQKVANVLNQKKTDPIIRTFPKIGRNSECICGSGKKYKRCCLEFFEKG